MKFKFSPEAIDREIGKMQMGYTFNSTLSMTVERHQQFDDLPQQMQQST